MVDTAVDRVAFVVVVEVHKAALAVDTSVSGCIAESSVVTLPSPLASVILFSSRGIIKLCQAY